MEILGICRKTGCLVILAAGLAVLALIWPGGLTATAAQAKIINIQSDQKVTSRIGQSNYAYEPDGATPDPALYYGDTALVKDKDYTVMYQDNKKVGTAAAIVTGKGAYTGQITLKYEIVPAELSTASLVLSPALIEDTGSAVTFSDLRATLFYVLPGEESLHALVEGQDFKIVGYGENVGPGTAKMTVGGLGNYTGIATVTFSIFRQNDVTDENNMAIDIEEGKLSYSNVLSYTGEPVKPRIIVTCRGKELNEDFDYVVEFSDNVEPGTATFTVKGIGSYKGELTGSFEIVED